jgi:eukaryotic-like serine/threonine-protein kinase
MDRPTQIGRYEIIEELGRGAMGVVYRAKDPAMDRVVALKTIISVALASPQGSEFRERFYREARTAGALTHPGIVGVFDVGEHEGMPFLVMEYVAGRTLADSTKFGERLGADRICEFGSQIASALGYAHQRGVVHRDVKPANILLTSKEAYGIERPKITDFGVAKLAEGQTTLTGQMIGTPAFMPPEQFTGAPIDGRSDVFSLGVVLYWMATGERPFPGESITAVSYKVVHTDPVPPGKLNPSLPAKLENIVLRCLAKNPADRFQSGNDLSRELNELRTGGTIIQPSTVQRAPLAADPDATRVENTVSWMPSAPASVTQTASAASVTETVSRTELGEPRRDKRMVLVAAVAVLLLVAVGGYALRGRQPSAIDSTTPPAATVAPEPAPAESIVAAEVSTPIPATPKPISVPASPSRSAAPAVATTSIPATGKSLEPGPTESVATPAVEEAPAAGPAPLDFDPRALDRRENARLEIDATRMPPDLEFAVEMNGKLYLQKTGPGIYKDSGALYVPPGVHEFRVTARSGEVTKESNTVSTEFRANKRNTLRIELRLQGMSANAGMPRGLYPSSQIVVTLR